MHGADSSYVSGPGRPDVVVLGAGISGLATAKVLKEAGFNVLILERTGQVGGLWTFRENDYGVMRFTHINVSKHNYCFSDFPFPDHVPDYPHHSDMAQYIREYATRFGLNELIQFRTKVISLERTASDWQITTIKVNDNGQSITPQGQEDVYSARFVAIATGHHSIPSYPKFKGEDSFKGEMIHSVKYKDVITNGMSGKRILVVGIGNSAVDVACNAVTEGRCNPVYISTRSGAWVFPNYIFGYPADHFVCRFFLRLPLKVATVLIENIVRLISGDPKRWNLNPKMRALQAHATIASTLLHHVQRQNIRIVPDIVRIDDNLVEFLDGLKVWFDCIINCTGYKIHLPYLSGDIQRKVVDPDANTIKLFKNVFSPELGSSLAFIGFVQPASGGILPISETQAMWFAELCRGHVKLPEKYKMLDDIKTNQDASEKRWYHSARHTIQCDPILYNDEIASYFGGKPELWKHPTLAWRLVFGTCGASQWRLQGPFRWSRASDVVRSVPVTPFMNYTGYFIVCLLLGAIYSFLRLLF